MKRFTCSLLCFISWCLHFMRRFWNQTFTWKNKTTNMFKYAYKWTFPGLFFRYFCLFKQLTVNMFMIKICWSDCIWTKDRCSSKRPLWQLSHNHCPQKILSLLQTFAWDNFYVSLTVSRTSSWCCLENLVFHLT